MNAFGPRRFGPGRSGKRRFEAGRFGRGRSGQHRFGRCLFEQWRIVLSFALATALALAWVGCAKTPPASQGNNQGGSGAQRNNENGPAGRGDNQNSSAARGDSQDEELILGQEVFNELKAKGEIIESSPLYDQLKPIADTITSAAQPQYNHPIRFYLVHEAQPNAFATPGGNVYVTDSLMYFVKNIDQLA